MSFNPVPIPPCPTTGELSVRFATLDKKASEDVNTHDRTINSLLAAPWRAGHRCFHDREPAVDDRRRLAARADVFTDLIELQARVGRNPSERPVPRERESRYRLQQIPERQTIARPEGKGPRFRGLILSETAAAIQKLLGLGSQRTWSFVQAVCRRMSLTNEPGICAGLIASKVQVLGNGPTREAPERSSVRFLTLLPAQAASHACHWAQHGPWRCARSRGTAQLRARRAAQSSIRN